MKSKRKVVQVALGILLLAILTVAVTNRPLRISYHRMCLHDDISFVPVNSRGASRFFSLAYWKWRLLKGKRSLAEEERWRQEIDAPRQIEALVGLGYYARREFALTDTYWPLPEWLLNLSHKTMSSVINGADWPDISFSPTESNTVQVRITAPVPVVQHWAEVIQDHEGQQ